LVKTVALVAGDGLNVPLSARIQAFNDGRLHGTTPANAVADAFLRLRPRRRTRHYADVIQLMLIDETRNASQHGQTSVYWLFPGKPLLAGCPFTNQRTANTVGPFNNRSHFANFA